MFKIVALIVISLLLLSCSSGNNYEKNIKKLDEVYGCDNPLRPLSTRKYKECLAAERGNDESFFELTSSFDQMFNNGGGNMVIQYSINPYLWQAALQTTNSYPLKIADNQGGYIETDWINKKNMPNNRCLIKINVRSRELVSNGVSTKFICEEKIDNQWVVLNDNFLEEEKQITLKILSTAASLSETAL